MSARGRLSAHCYQTNSLYVRVVAHPDRRTVIVRRSKLKAPYRRGRQTVRPFSPQEDALLTRMRVNGQGTTAIARAVSALGSVRSPATINMRLKTLAQIEDDD